MMKWLVVLSFVAGAALSWGVYVPVVHRAAFELKSNLRAFMFVGAAYFVVAVKRVRGMRLVGLARTNRSHAKSPAPAVAVNQNRRNNQQDET